MAKEPGYTLADFTSSETVYNLRLWYALRLVEIEERKAEHLRQEVLNGLDANKGRFTRGF